MGNTLAIYTARIDYPGDDRLDVTRKGESVFGPSWELLTPFLERRRLRPLGEGDWAEYAAKYTVEMRRSYHEHRAWWDDLLERSEVTLCCYCTNPERCHRTVLAELVIAVAKSRGIEAVYRGECAYSAGAKRGTEAERNADPPHFCHALGCKVEVPPKLLMCLRHWRMVPKDLQARVWRTYRPGQEITKDPTEEYLEAADTAIRAVAQAEKGLSFKAGGAS